MRNIFKIYGICKELERFEKTQYSKDWFFVSVKEWDIILPCDKWLKCLSPLHQAGRLFNRNTAILAHSQEIHFGLKTHFYKKPKVTQQVFMQLVEPKKNNYCEAAHLFSLNLVLKSRPAATWQLKGREWAWHRGEICTTCQYLHPRSRFKWTMTKGLYCRDPKCFHTLDW